MATFGGSFDITGMARMCQTFVYMGHDASTYSRQTVTVNQTSPENYPTIAQCTARCISAVAITNCTMLMP